MALMTKGQAAEELQISVRTLEGLINRGQLPAYRIGPKCVRIDSDDLDEYVAARRIAPAARTRPVEVVRPCRYIPGMKVV